MAHGLKRTHSPKWELTLTFEAISSSDDYFSQTMASALSEVGISDANDLRQLLHDPDDALATIAQFEEVNRINLELRLKNIYLSIFLFPIIKKLLGLAQF